MAIHRKLRDNFFWMGKINKASLVINTEEGLLDSKYTPEFSKALVRLLKEGDEGGARPQSVITFEPLWIQAAGPEVTRIHVGRSSQDMLTTCRVAQMRDCLLILADAVLNVVETLNQLAKLHISHIVPAYTNGVAAQPTSYGHYLNAYAQSFQRGYERIMHMYKNVNRSPMGCTVLNGTGWPLNRQRMAGYLGFDQVADNAYDATQIYTMEYPVEAAGVVTPLAIHVCSFIEDVMQQYAQPHPWILLEEGGENTYVSSAMPQKRNPGILARTRTAASTIIGEAQGAIIRAHNTPPGMTDARSSKTLIMMDDTTEMLGQFIRVLKALRLNTDRALEELNLDWTSSQELADRLMKDFDVPFRLGHHVASEMVTVARIHDYRPTTFPYEEICHIYADEIVKTDLKEVPTSFPLSEEEFRSTLEPTGIVSRRATQGGPQLEEVERMVAVTDEWLRMGRYMVGRYELQIENSLDILEKEFSQYLK